MSKLSLFTLLVFVFVFYVRHAVTAAVEMEEKRSDEKTKYAPLWFGPRVGRKKRNPSDEFAWNMDREELEVLLSFIRKSPWTIMMFGNGKERMMEFNPKFSKEPAEDMNDEVIGDLVQRSMFAPRLGRADGFFQRLGRD